MSDSQAALKALKAYTFKSKLVTESAEKADLKEYRYTEMSPWPSGSFSEENTLF
jgi:hypothetical protein